MVMEKERVRGRGRGRGEVEGEREGERDGEGEGEGEIGRGIGRVGLCTRCSGFYLLCYALILSKYPYYAQPLHPLCSLYAHYAASCLHVLFKLLDLRDSSSRQALQKSRPFETESASPGSSFKR